MRERLAADALHVWIASLAIPTRRLEATLGADERERANRLAGTALRRRLIARRGLRRAILARYAGCPPEQLRFTHGPAGKPELAGGAVRFSCSSSGDLALVVVARERAVGIDVERLRPVAGALDIARSLFPSEQHAALLALSGAERNAAFLRTWTLIEARVKAYGAGLAMAFDGAAAQPPDAWSVQPVEPGPGHVGAIAAESSNWRMEWRSW